MADYELKITSIEEGAGLFKAELEGTGYVGLSNISHEVAVKRLLEQLNKLPISELANLLARYGVTEENRRKGNG
jgi:hypothetical protein